MFGDMRMCPDCGCVCQWHHWYFSEVNKDGSFGAYRCPMCRKEGKGLPIQVMKVDGKYMYIEGEEKPIERVI